MRPKIQPRVTVVARCTAVLTLCSLSLATLAQALPAPKSSTQAAPADVPVSSANIDNSLTANGTAPTKHNAQAAENAYLAGARLLQRSDLTGAELQFRKAAALNPSNSDYALALSVTHQRRVNELVQQSGKARLLGQSEKAETLLAEARLLDPENNIVGQHVDSGALPKVFHPEIEPWIREAPAIAGPITLIPNSELKSFHIHSDEQDVIRQVLSAYGIRAVFDESVQHDNIRFDLDDELPYSQAAPIVLSMGHLFSVPLDSKSVIIAKDTTENRERLEHQLQETIFIPGMTNEEMDNLGTLVKNIFDVKQVSVGKSSGTLVIRAPQDTLTYINLTLADLIDGGSEVMIDLQLYSVDKTNQRNIGAQLPQQIGIYSVSSAAQNLVSANQSIVNQAIAQGLIPAGSSNVAIALALVASGLVQSTLLSSTIGFFGGGLTTTGVTTNQNPSFNLALTASDTRALDDMQIRVADRQSATFRVGERYPITTATYSSGLTGSAAALANTTVNGVPVSSLLNSAVGTAATIPQIQYEDLGLTLKATPTVQKSGEIRVHIDLKIEALTGNSLSNIPILNSQQFASDVTLNDGETALMASSLTKSESASLSGYPGISQLPGFQTATGDQTTDTTSSELILLVTPHITRRRSNLTVGPRIAINLPEPPS
jgi:general secretion pathway protein D